MKKIHIQIKLCQNLKDCTFRCKQMTCCMIPNSDYLVVLVGLVSLVAGLLLLFQNIKLKRGHNETLRHECKIVEFTI